MKYIQLNQYITRLFLLLIALFTYPALSKSYEFGKTQEDTSLADNMASYTYTPGAEWVNYRGPDWINYRLHSPEKLEEGKRYPLLVFLHGWGERGTDNVAHIKKGVPELLDYGKKTNKEFFLLAPQSQYIDTWLSVRVDQNDSYVSPDKPSRSLKTTIRLIKDFIKNNPVDPDRIYVTGLSMGGFGSWDILVREPDMFAASVPVASGNADDAANAIKHIPIWAIHGAKDKNIPPAYSRRSIASLQRAGGNPKYSEFGNMGHSDPDWHAVYSNTEIWDWVFAQSK